MDHQEHCTFPLTMSDATPDPGCASWLATARQAVSSSEIEAQPLAAQFRHPPAFEALATRAAYIKKVRASQKQIAEGNTYEFCLTTSLS